MAGRQEFLSAGHDHRSRFGAFYLRAQQPGRLSPGADQAVLQGTASAEPVWQEEKRPTKHEERPQPTRAVALGELDGFSASERAGDRQALRAAYAYRAVISRSEEPA